jgi:hypothetical protein
MRRTISVGKLIAGFAYSYKKHEEANERVLLDTFAKTQKLAKQKLKTSLRFFYKPDEGHYRLFSVHMKMMQELPLNLDEPNDGFPVLDDDEEIEPEIKMINGRLVIEDAFDLKNPVVLRRKK